ncbi:MAG: hypothetical protein Q9159_006716 [Coniocarpon cinnabarinum]
MFTNFSASGLQVVQYTGPLEKHPARPKLNKAGACTASISTQQLATQCDEATRDVYLHQSARLEPDPSDNSLLPRAHSWTSFKPIDKACAPNSADDTQAWPMEIPDDCDPAGNTLIPPLDELIGHEQQALPARVASDLSPQVSASDNDTRMTVSPLPRPSDPCARKTPASPLQQNAQETIRDNCLSQDPDPVTDTVRVADNLVCHGSPSRFRTVRGCRSSASRADSASAPSEIRDDANSDIDGGGSVVTNDRVDDEAQDWEVKRILDSRVTTSGDVEFRVCWRSTWERKENLHCPLLLKQFKQRRKRMRLNPPANRARKLAHIPAMSKLG